MIRRTIVLFWIETLVLAGAVCVVVFLSDILSVRYRNTLVQWQHEATQSPYEIGKEFRGGPTGSVSVFVVTTEMFMPPIASRTFILRADDKLMSLIANGSPVVSPSLPAAASHSNVSIDLSSYLHIGWNTLQITSEDYGGSAKLSMWQDQQKPLGVLLIQGFVTLLGIVYVVRRFS